MEWRHRIFGSRGDADQRTDKERVAVYDFDHQEILWVSVGDLPAGFLQAQMEGVEHLVWVDPERLRQGQYQHPPFGPEVRAVFAQLNAAFDEVYPRTIDEWEDGFRRDRNPEREIAIWLHIAEVYETLTCERPLSLEAKQDYLKILLACSTMLHEQVLKSVSLSAITVDEAAEAIAAYSREKTPPN
jgi:hypothetical protein